MYRALVEEQLSCRQIAKRLNAANTPTPTGKNTVWQHATIRNIVANRTYTGQARYNYRQPVLPQSRKKEEHQLRSLKTGRRYRTESEWMWSDAPAIITVELFDTAQRQLQRNAASARKMYRPTAHR
jgi:Recombinase